MCQGAPTEYLQPLAVLISVYMISLISPGPNFIVVTRTSIAVSRKAGLFAGLGLACASLTWALLAMMGVNLLLAHFQGLYLALQLAGAVYLVWLGIKMIAGAKKPLLGFVRKVGERRSGKAKTGEEAEFTGCK